MVQNQGNYVDSKVGGGFAINLETDPQNWPNRGANVEGSVAGLLWDLFDPVDAAMRSEMGTAI